MARGARGADSHVKQPDARRYASAVRRWRGGPRKAAAFFIRPFQAATSFRKPVCLSALPRPAIFGRSRLRPALHGLLRPARTFLRPAPPAPDASGHWTPHQRLVLLRRRPRVHGSAREDSKNGHERIGRFVTPARPRDAGLPPVSDVRNVSARDRQDQARRGFRRIGSGDRDFPALSHRIAKAVRGLPPPNPLPCPRILRRTTISPNWVCAPP